MNASQFDFRITNYAMRHEAQGNRPVGGGRKGEITAVFNQSKKQSESNSQSNDLYICSFRFTILVLRLT